MNWILILVIKSTTTMDYAKLTKKELLSKIDSLEKEVHELKEGSDTTFNKAAVGIAHISQKGELILVNNMFAQMFGYDADSMHGLKVDEISYPGEINHETPEVRKVWLGELDHVSTEKRYIRKDKSTFWGNLTVSHYKSTSVEQEYFIAVLKDITEKKTAIERFIKEKEFSDSIINNIPAQFFVNSFEDGEMRLVKWNKNLETLSGYSPEELMNMSSLDFYLEKDHHALSRAVEELIKTGRSSIEINAMTKSGRLIPIHYEGYLFTQADKQYIIGIGIDISDRIKAQEALRINEEKYSALVENSNDGIAIYNSKGIIVFANRAANNELGYLEDELIGKNIFEVLVPAYVDEVVKRNKARSSGVKAPEITEIELIRKDGTHIPVEVNTSVIEYEGEKSFLAFLRNITKKKIAEEKLKESEERFRLMSDLSKEGVVIHRSGFALEVNKAFCDIFGYSVDEIIGTNPMPKLFSPATIQVLAESFKEDISPPHEIQGIKKNGSIITLSVEGRSIQYKGERVRVGTIRDITGQKKIEEELKIKDQAIESSINAIGIADLDGKMIYINQAGIDFWGYATKEEILERPMTEFWQKEYIDVQLEDLKEKGYSNNEGVGIKKDGALIYVQYSVHIVKDSSGEPHHIFGSFIDITEKRKAENALKEAEERFSKAFNNLPDPISFTTIPEGKYVDVNPTFEKLSGYSREELIGKKTTDFEFYVNKEDRETIFKELKRSGRVEGFVFPFKIRNGQIKECVLYSEQVELQGEPCLLSIMRDITEQKRAEEAIKFEQYLLHSLMDNSTDNIYFKDLDSRFIRINASLAKKFGLTHPKEARGKSDMDFYGGEHAKNALADEQNIIKTGQPIINKEERESWQDGKITWSLTSKLPLYDEDGKITGTFGISREITEQKIAEQALRESEEKFKIIFESTPDSIILISLEGKLLDGNKAAEKMLGIKSEDVVGKNLLELEILTENELARAQQQMAESMQGLATKAQEYTWNHTDGSQIQVEVSTFPVFINEEAMILGISRDITERKKAEKELENYREDLEELVKTRTAKLEESLKENLKLTKAIEQSHATVVITDKEGNIEYVNENFTRVTGYSFKEAVGQNPRILKSGEMPDSHYKEMWETIVSGQIWRGEFINKTKSGELYWESAIISPLIDEKGELTHFVAVKEDIQERKEVEEELRQFKQFADTSIEGFGMADLRARVLYQNKRLCDLCGIEKPAFKESFLQFYPDEAKKTLRKTIIPELIEKGSWRGELDHIHPEGGTFPTVHNFFLIRDENGDPKRLAATITDITERKKIESELKKSKEQAEEANRTKSAFLANMSHEIRTPMNSILGFSEMLSAKIEDPKLISYLNSILSSGKNLLTLINDILDLSKVEAGRIEIDNTLIHTSIFFNDIISIFKAFSKEKNLEFHSNIADDLPSGLYLDELRLRQILINLLGNAVKFTEIGSVSLTVHSKIKAEKSTRKSKEQFADLIIRVEDTGIGMSEKFLPNLFKTFQQEDGEITRKYGGTGLGLAISKKLAELMNGEIQVKSTVLKGSTFTLYLKNVKVSYDLKEQVPGSDLLAEHLIFPNRAILVADDNAEVRKYYMEVFSNTNLVIRTANNGLEAFDQAKKIKPDLIITDLKMPMVDGYKLLKKLKKHPDLSKIPVIAATASVMKEEIEKIKLNNFDGMLLKPISYNDLMTEVQKFIKPKKTSKRDPKDPKPTELQIPDKFKNKLPEILGIIEEEWMTDWEKLQKKQPMDEVESFGMKIRNAGEEYQIEYLSNFGQQIIQAVQAFDIEQIRIQIKEFPEIIEKLKRLQ